MATAERAAYMRAYRTRNRERRAAYKRAWRAANRDRARARQREADRRFQAQLRREVLLAYGDGSCVECGHRPEDVLELELDHVNGDGRDHGGQHRGTALYRRLRKAGFPGEPPLQTLCHRCHVAKSKRECAERRAARNTTSCERRV